jgi:hypothetical protein
MATGWPDMVSSIAATVSDYELSELRRYYAQVAGAKFGTGSKQQDAVMEAWDKVGITVSAPSEVVESVPGILRIQWWFQRSGLQTLARNDVRAVPFRC